jgi:glycosyltransferase involved in cell wall biosynthesis
MTSEILHVITNLSGRGGAETALARIVAGSDDVSSVVSLMDVSPAVKQLFSGTTIQALGSSSPISMFMSAWTLARIIRDRQPDIIVCWMYHANFVGALAARLAGSSCKLVWNVRHSLDDWSSETISTRCAVRAGILFRGFADGMIFNSHRSHQQHQAIGYTNRNSVVIPNGVSLPPRIVKLPAMGRRVGIAGRFHPHKDYRNFFLAAKCVLDNNPNVQIIAAGRGVSMENEGFSNLIREIDVPFSRITLMGEADSLDDFYKSIDVFVLSSRTEGFPNVLIEAMSYGVPCVTTDVGDAGRIVGESGVVVRPRDPDALFRGIDSMLSLPLAEYHQRSSQARKRVEREFSIESVVGRYDEFLNGL